MTRDDIRAEWDSFIEYPSPERTFVTTTSALLFAEYVVARATARERDECAALCDRFALRDMHPAECAAAIRARGEK